MGNRDERVVGRGNKVHDETGMDQGCKAGSMDGWLEEHGHGQR